MGKCNFHLIISVRMDFISMQRVSAMHWEKGFLSHTHTQKSQGVRAQSAELVLVGLHQGTKETWGVHFY